MRYPLPVSFQRSLLFVLCCGLLFSACTTDDDADGVPNDKDKCPTVKAKTPDGCPAPKEISAVHFYLETSASMGGYFRKDAEFATVVSDLTAKIDKNIRPLDISFIAEKTEKFPGSPQDFSSAIANTRIAPQKSSQLHSIIRQVADKTGPSDIAVLVSDCILSFPDADIRANPEVNREKAPSTLKSNIYATFADLNKKKGFGASIYAFRSRFYGTYYNYRNGTKTLAGDRRPFYVWVIGNKELLGKFNTQLADISSFQPEQELHFGTSDKSVTDFRIIPGISRQGSWMEAGDRAGLEEVGDPKKAPVQAALALDLSGLPPYAQDPAYLNEHLQVTAQGCVATVKSILKKDADVSKLRSEPQKAAYEKSTHILLLTVKEMLLKDATVTVRLPLRYATWYTDWSCMDDLNLPASCSGRTFALEHLITGVKEAYETKNEDYINFTLTLEK